MEPEALIDFFPLPDRERAGYLLNDLAQISIADSPKCFLDMGAGSGSMAAVTACKFPGIRGTLVDVVSRIQFLDKLPESASANLTCLPWPKAKEVEGQQFDLVMSMDVLEHIPNWRASLAELKGRVAMGGWLYVQVPSDYPSPNYKTPGVVINRLAGIFGMNNPALHVRHGLSVKALFDSIGSDYEYLVASEGYVLNGTVPCQFKPRTRVLAKRRR